MLLFSSDFPHVEGGRNPVKRFEDNMEGISDEALGRFYRDNFIDLMAVAGRVPSRPPIPQAA